MLPKPTKSLEARTGDLEIEKNLGKTLLVSGTGRGPGAGFYVSMRGKETAGLDGLILGGW
jgi:hypothetical protein